MRSLSLVALTAMLWTGQVPCASAGLYHPEWLPIEDFDANGYAQPLGADNFWNSYMKAHEVATPRAGLSPGATAIGMTAGSMTLLGTNRTGILSSARVEVENQVIELRGKSSRTAEEDAKLTADLILLNDPKGVNEALNLLREPENGSFVIAAHQARAFQSLKLLKKAEDLEESALTDYKFPEKLFHMNKRQLTWYHRLEKDYYLPWLQNRDKEEQQLAANGKGVADISKDTLDPLFPKPINPKIMPVRFVGKAGIFKPGELAASEKMKLPPDAIAIVQQMMLWNPWDFRLAWLLAELYIVEGNYEIAERLLDNCRQSGYSPTELSQHREAIQPFVESFMAEKLAKQQAAEAKMIALREAEIEQSNALKKAELERLQVEEQLKRQKEHDKRMNRIYVWTATALVLGVLAYLQTREIVRRLLARKSAAPLE